MAFPVSKGRASAWALPASQPLPSPEVQNYCTIAAYCVLLPRFTEAFLCAWCPWQNTTASYLLPPQPLKASLETVSFCEPPELTPTNCFAHSTRFHWETSKFLPACAQFSGCRARSASLPQPSPNLGTGVWLSSAPHPLAQGTDPGSPAPPWVCTDCISHFLSSEALTLWTGQAVCVPWGWPIPLQREQLTQGTF